MEKIYMGGTKFASCNSCTHNLYNNRSLRVKCEKYLQVIIFFFYKQWHVTI